MAIIENPNRQVANEVKRRLKETGGYCPCRLIKDDDTKCMCKEFKEAEEGMCHCGLFIKTKD